MDFYVIEFWNQTKLLVILHQISIRKLLQKIMIIMFQGTYGKTLEFDCMRISNRQFLGAYRIAILFHLKTMCLLFTVIWLLPKQWFKQIKPDFVGWRIELVFTTAIKLCFVAWASISWNSKNIITACNQIWSYAQIWWQKKMKYTTTKICYKILCSV